MADVHVHVENNKGQKTALTLDEKSEFIAHLKKLVAREDLKAVEVKRIPAGHLGIADKAKAAAEAEAKAQAEADAKAEADKK